MTDTPKWHAKGDWFDACSCDIPCPCEFAQPPTGGHCEGVLAYHIDEGAYGATSLSGLSVLTVLAFDGNLWAGQGAVSLGLLIDERADADQRAALAAIFEGIAGGHPAGMAQFVRERRGVAFVPINFHVADGLAHWGVEVPGKIEARVEALSGPTTPPGKRVQLLNPPGSEVGGDGVATWGRVIANTVDVHGFKWDWAGKSSKHIPFDWTGG
jgi:hypothetical protein